MFGTIIVVLILVLLVGLVIFSMIRNHKKGKRNCGCGCATCSDACKKKVNDIMNFEDLIEKRHSIRSYSQEPVDDLLLEKIVAAAKLAPSSRNKKPCSYIVVKDKSMLEKLSLSKAGGSSMLKDAGAAIIVTGDTKKSDVWIEDCSIAMTYLHLAATDCGLGSCWIQLRNRQTAEGTSSTEYVKKLFNLEEHIEPLAVLSIGNI